MTDENPPCALYLVSPESLDPGEFAPLLGRVLDAGNVSCFQLRLPEATEAELRQAAEKLAPVAWERDIAFLICDHPSLARELNLDGVHLENEASAKAVKAARKTLGDTASIGVSCRTSRHIAMEMGEAGADYVSFGPVFMSPTKGLPAMSDAMETIQWWAAMMEIPQVAVGGVSPENCADAISAGTDFIAAISSVWSHPDGPEAAVRAFGQAIDAAAS